jgi:hypothetical protein
VSRNVSRKAWLAVAASAAALGLATAAQAAAPAVHAAQPNIEQKHAKLRLVRLPSERFHKTIEVVREQIEKRRRKAAEDFGLAGGVSQATLSAIAACESGGDYTTNTGNGFYGAYQFDQGTWASVGGSGLPSDASPAEQDYRASLLYSRAGSSPWPVCGV